MEQKRAQWRKRAELSRNEPSREKKKNLVETSQAEKKSRMEQKRAKWRERADLSGMHQAETRQLE